MKKLIATGIIAIGVLIPTGHADAVGGILGCQTTGSVNSLFGALSGREVPVDDKQTNELAAKECLLDGLTTTLRQALITTITQNIVNWINSGFDGAPVFVTDLSAFLNEVADNTELDFILGDELGFLCSPFELDIRLALAVQRQPFQDRIECSLSDVSNNIQGFLEGDFSKGGWPAWIQLHTDLSNSPVGAYFEASVELEGRKTEAVNEQLEVLRWGSGFFSQSQCFGAQSVKGTGSEDDQKLDLSSQSACEAAGGSWEIVTPGTQINSQLTQVLGSGFKQLELADEIDEIINALLAQLAQQLFTSADGLRGLSSSNSSSSRNNQSYLQNLTNETGQEAVSSGTTALTRDINGAIGIEEDYQDALTDLIYTYQDAKTTFESRYQCLSNAGYVTQANTASTTISAVINPHLTRFEEDIQTSTDTVSQLLAIRGEVNSASSVSELNAAADAYDAMLQTGVVHTNADIALLEQELEQAQSDLERAIIRLGIESGGQCSN